MVLVGTGIFIADLDEDALDKMAKATRCLISTVGPFIRYGTAVVEACAVNGTHYVDSTGEITWVKEIVDKYHKTAKVNGAIVSETCLWLFLQNFTGKARLLTGKIDDSTVRDGICPGRLGCSYSSQDHAGQLQLPSWRCNILFARTQVCHPPHCFEF